MVCFFFFCFEMYVKWFNNFVCCMCMFEVFEVLFLEVFYMLVDLDSDWILLQEGSVFYICFYMFVMDEFIGVKLFVMYWFIIFIGFVGFYYLKLVSLIVDWQFVCVVVKGGIGEVKVVGNYVVFFLFV